MATKTDVSYYLQAWDISIDGSFLRKFTIQGQWVRFFRGQPQNIGE